jgi:lipopolysaccharide transport system ATP-binding protein
MLSWLSKIARTERPVPTTLHITHAKAGSSWIDAILRKLFGQAVAPRGKLAAAEVGHDLSRFVFTPGRIYSAMFMTHEQVAAHPELDGVQRFILIRDLRDTLVSLYFSLKVSHPLMPNGRTAEARERLQELNVESGLLHLMDGELHGAAAMHRSWLGRDEILLRYEDLLQRDEEILRPLFLEKLRLPASEESLRTVLGKCSFEAKFQRKLGTVDPQSHGRQGAPGDWERHFTPRVAERFAERFGDLLIAGGYEKDTSWTQRVAERGRGSE